MIRINRFGRGRICICEFEGMHSSEMSLTLRQLQGHPEAEEGVSMGLLKDRKEADFHIPTYTETTASTESSTRGRVPVPSSIY
jgi:hypothetical protein